METENCSRRIHNIRIQFDDITISPITFMEFFSDIYDYIDFLIEHLTDKEEKNKYNFALYNMETAFKQEQEFESLSKEEKIRRIKKDFGSILLCDEETAENKQFVPLDFGKFFLILVYVIATQKRGDVS